MFQILLLLLIMLFSCNYPDIDTVPEFNSMNISLEETLDKCKIKNHNNNFKEDCYKAQKQIINGL